MSKYQASILLYAIAMIGLGLAGTVMAPNHEVISAIAGGAIGVIEIFFLALTKSNPRVGYMGAAAIALLTALKFIGDLISKGPKWHLVTIFILSALLVVILLGGHFLERKLKKPASE